MSEPRFSARRVQFICLLTTIIAFLVIAQLYKPLKTQISERYRVRGDIYLINQSFAQAQNEYKQALTYDSNNQLAKEREELTQKASTDIALLASFYREKGVEEVTGKLNRALEKFTSPLTALSIARDFYNTGDFVYAQYPLQRAVELDPNYPEAWHYLYLTYIQLASVESSFSQKAAEAKKQRDLLTPKYLLEEEESR